MTAASTAPRRWTINGDFLAIEPTGVARYALEVTKALDALISERHPLTLDLDLDLVASRPPAPATLQSIAVRVVAEFSRPRLPQVWVQLQLPAHVPGGLLSFCNLAPVRARRHIACIHDLLTSMTPDSYSLPFRLAHRVVLPLLGRQARLITTVSKLSRDHLVQHGIASADKIVVTYNGADHALRWDASRSSLRLGPRPFVLCLGRKQKHKNGELMRRIAGPLDAIGIDLYMAGQVDEQTLATFGPRPRNVRLLGRISDDDLARALSEARCFVFPSRIEGFGLPAVEAMARGCPVVASTSPCLPEVCGDAALYADPDDADGWVAAIAKVHADAEVRRRMVQAGRERVGAYSWRRIAEAYLELMLRVDRDTSPN